MKTKFVLHGGFAQKQVQQNDAFFQEMLKDLPENAKVLLVYFADPDEKVQLRTEQDTRELEKNKGSRNLELRVASEATFIGDCAWANGIYLHGGQTAKLLEALKKYENLEQLFSGKTIAGDSAGVKVLGKYFYSNSTHTIGEGFGILPLKIFAHYVEGASNPFANVAPDAETLFLREYQTVVKYY